MRSTARARGIFVFLYGVVVSAPACSRTGPLERSNPSRPSGSASTARLDPLVGDAGNAAAPEPSDAGSDGTATLTPWSPPDPHLIDGPHQELSLDPGRPVYYAMPTARMGVRLVGHLHGMCGPPSYACGRWIGAGTEVGAMVCPTGNARCGDSPVGPPSWEAPTWSELVDQMDRDLETAIRKVERARPGAIRREGAVLTGYSRGAYAAPVVASKHPHRWPYLVLIEANVSISAAALRRAGVRAVALVAGEQGNEIAGMRKTLAELDRTGFPARLFVMRRTGHLYGDDMEHVMHDALAFVLSNEETTHGTGLLDPDPRLRTDR